MDILAELNVRKVDYDEIKQTCQFKLVKDTPVEISIIIPVCGRVEFTEIACRYFKEAINHVSEVELRQNKSPFRKRTRIALTIVEHSDAPEHRDICPEWVNHIWLPKNGTRFNKCLAHNIGVLFSNQAKSYLFHDLDTLVPKNFFTNVMLNMRGNDAVQTFTNRRLLYANPTLSESIIKKETDINTLHPMSPNLRVATSGATGGSMFMTSKLFFDVGGYDNEFYSGYSVEDTAMYMKLDMVGSLVGCNNPPNELIHLHHTYSGEGNITQPEAFSALQAYTDLSYNDKLKYMREKSEHLKKYFYHDKS